jgi:hypothetical protein
MTEFDDKVMAEIKRYFPHSEIKNTGSVENIGFGMAEVKTEGDSFIHRIVSGNSYSSLDEAESDCIFNLGELRFYKDPDFVFIRLIHSGADLRSIHEETPVFTAAVRFSLGYKL